MELANHGVVLLKQLNAQREFGFLCDCTVAVGDVLFKAHKAVLAAFSNYFRMLFVHQGSDCVRLKPADIQPEIFSYLLNLMYTGKLSPQLIDPLRLEQGVKFLHAFPLLQGMGQVSPTALSHSGVGVPLATSLYGIQIPDQPSQPFSPHPPDSSPSESGRLLDDRWALGESGPVQSAFRGDGGTDQFAPETQGPDPAGESPGASAILRVKPSIMRRKASSRRHYSCHLCGSRFAQRAGLAQHLLLHAQALLPEAWASPSGSSASPAPAAFTPDPPPLRDEESPRCGPGDGGDDGEGPPATDSPGPEAEGFRADTPPPSDIADIDNLEGADPDPGTRRRRYECATCGRKFIQKSHWREHTYIHTGKPYRCSACGKSFCRAKQAARHACLAQSAESYTIVDRHSLELCASEDSNQMETLFLDSSRPYKCNVCESTLSSPDEILKHPCFSLNVPVPSASDDQITLHNGRALKDNELGSSSDKPIKSEDILIG